jgi:hypothetical protein
MTSKSEILEKINKVLDGSDIDILSINFENGRSIEFANFEQEEILYNIANIDEQNYIEVLEQNIDLGIESKGDIFITFNRDNNEDAKKYLTEIQEISEIIDSSREDISAMELKNIH